MSMERRLLLAFVLMGAVLFLTPYLFQTSAPPPKKETPAPAAQQPSAANAPAAASKAPPPAPSAPAPSEPAPSEPVSGKVLTAAAEQAQTIETNLFRVVFSNKGGVVTSWKLKKYTDGQGKELELVNTAAVKTPRPFALYFKDDKKSAADVNHALFTVQPQAGGLGVDFDYSDGRVTARKRFRFERNSYLVEVTTDVRENGSPVAHWIEWRGGFGDMAVHSAASTQRAVYFDVAANKLQRVEAKAAKNGAVTYNGNYSFLGMMDNYFAAVFLPKKAGNVDVIVTSDQAASSAHQDEQPYVGVAVGGWPANSFEVFVGPKDLDVLNTVNPKLTQMIDFGWFALLARPLFLALHWIHDHWVGNWGWAIILITIVINFLLFPLKLTSLKSMKRMQSLQPQIAVINEKYRNVGLRDPRKAQQNQEVMELYKKHGVNPMGGCFPMLLQIPFFIAFYNVLSNAIELRHANWLWVTDLSQPEHLAIRILPLAMISTQFVMQKMTPSTSMDPAQQRIMMLMPLMLGVMFYGVASGLVLYWLTGNLVSIAQQWFINKTAPAGPAPAPATPAKRNRRS
jgi:YidC/Oxa1 family membrane protein insertase